LVRVQLGTAYSLPKYPEPKVNSGPPGAFGLKNSARQPAGEIASELIAQPLHRACIQLSIIVCARLKFGSWLNQ
jgi:hypothetical protein